ncbi:MAG: hypothetical protein GY930_11480 [bacterium]|nr:hypothetical protein [bacterium]
MNDFDGKQAASAKPWALYGLGSWLLLCLVASCLSEPDLPPQGWWQERGSVMPHDSFPTDCTLCHIGSDWHTIREDIDFDHEAETGYALEGAHAQALCLRCHNDRGPVQAFESRGCAGCHGDVHRGLLGEGCSSCHDVNSWQATGPVADHSRTRFPLTGMHAATECWQCHPGAGVGEFSGADPECLSCHADELARVADPDHVLQGWTRRCDRCHLPTSWDGPGFRHSVFALVGSHAIEDCSRCHTTGVFDALSPLCVGCHLEEYENTLDPPHLTYSYPTQCQNCHGLGVWEDAVFSHQGLLTNCVTCHEDDYLGVANPNHVGQGYPTTCELCHTTVDWEDDIFDHAWPRHGPHEFMACVDCHLNAPLIVAPGGCVHCHFHRQKVSLGQHQGIENYVWSNPECIACHPAGY